MSTLNDQDLKKYEEHFSLFDTDSDGNLNIEGLGTCLRSLGFIISNKELEKFSRTRSQFSFSDMLSVSATLTRGNVSEQDQIKELQEAFSVLDPDNKGTINLERLKEILANVGEVFSEEETSKLASRFDNNNIDMKTFVDALMSKR